jgi:hypothetical protein
MKTLLEKIKSFFSFLDFNNDSKVSAEDAEIVKALAKKKFKEANELINGVKAEAKTRVNRVKQEAADVVVAAKETINQVGDIVDAAKGKERKGRKKK